MICGVIHPKITILILWILAFVVVDFRRFCPDNLAHITMISSLSES
jgi:hypothetical protein